MNHKEILRPPEANQDDNREISVNHKEILLYRSGCPKSHVSTDVESVSNNFNVLHT